jgi:outer membrane protein assembly factor BamB
VVAWDPADVRPLPLRWLPTKQDESVVAGLAEGRGFAGRVGLQNVAKTDPKTGQTVEVLFDDPRSGYDEYGPRLRHDADIVLFGTPETSLAAADLAAFLRRLPSANHPAAGGFFVHHLWSPFQAGFHGLLIACHDAAGAEAAVAALATLEPAPPVPPASGGKPPVTTPGGPASPLDDLIAGRFGRPVLDIAFAADGRRVFAAVAGIGTQLVTLSADGKVDDKRVLHHARDGLYRTVEPPLTVIDDRILEVGLAGSRYRYAADGGFVSRWSPPPASFFGKNAVRPAAATVLDDPSLGRSYLGGRRRLHALDREGRLLWTFDDEAGPLNAERLKHPRLLFPRAVSGDGRVLLVSGFASVETVFSAKPANAIVLGLDPATGRLLWRKEMLLDTGSVVPLDEHFMVVDDGGTAHVLRAADGHEAGGMRPIKGTARVLPVPGRGELLVIENDAFVRDGPGARVFLRPLDGRPDRGIPLAGRVTDAAVLPDGRSLMLVTTRGETLRVAVADGRIEWRAATPSGGILRRGPDDAVVWIGGRDGVIYLLDAATGRLLGSTDLNPFNLTTPEDFVRQMAAVGEVPVARDARTLPPAPVEPSYRATLDPARVPLGPNLGTGTLAADTPLAVRVEAGRTYLVELIASAAVAERVTPRTRLEIAVTGKRATVNLPVVARLPLTAAPARRRVAFRADEAGEVVLRLRAVEPAAGPDAKHAPSYDTATPSPAGLVIAEPSVAAIGFQGPNLLLEGGPKAARAAAGDLECTVIPWTGGSSLVRSAPFPCPATALRLVNGRIAGDDTAWGPAVTSAAIDSATGVVRFKKPRALTAIAVYEDTTGPVLTPAGVAERASSRYGLFVRRSGGRELIPVGHVVDNTNLINVFTCPAEPVEEIHWIWAGRTDTDRTDGPVRMAEIEAYAEDLDDLLEEPADDSL